MASARMGRHALAWLLLLAMTTARAAEIGHPPLDEVSGVTASTTYPGVFWVHNDSGDLPRIFAIHADGSVLMPAYERDRYQTGGTQFFKTPWPGITVVNAANVDWEDITSEDGWLYIADTGNNGNARRDLGVYVVPEPNPEATGMVRAMRFLPIRYPDQHGFPGERWHFDCEAVFIDHGVLYFLTKHRIRGQIAGWEAGSKLYRLDTAFTDRYNTLTLVSQHPGLTLVTAAELSPNGKQLAVLTYPRIWLFERPAKGDDWLASPARVLDIDWGPENMVEALTWKDPDTLLIAGESRKLVEVPVADLAAP